MGLPLFDLVPDLDTLENACSQCQKCGLARRRTNVVFGHGSRTTKLMFVGEAPGFFEDQEGLAFVGKSGRLLDEVLAELDLTRADVYTANTLKCRPPRNRDPENSETEACRPWLAAQIAALRPTVVVALGRRASAWFGMAGTVAALRGRPQASILGPVVVPTWHPAAVLRDAAGSKRAQFKADLQAAIALCLE